MLNQFRHIVQPTLIAIIVCYVLDELHVPVAWLIGSLLVGVAYALGTGQPHPLPKMFLNIAKAVIGIAAAARFVPDNLVTMVAYIIPLLLALGITGGLAMLNGYLIARWSGIDIVTSLLGSIPGTATANVAISSEFGANPSIVAVLQYLRLLLVAFLVPIIAGLLSSYTDPQPNVTILVPPNPAVPISQLWNIMVIGGCCTIGIWLGQRLKLPTKGFLGAFICGLIPFGLSPGQYSIPQPVMLAALLIVGISAGLKFDWQHITGLSKAMLLEIVLVLWLVACCLGIAYLLHNFTNIDITTAVLAFAPGGMEAMIATSNQLGADTGLVLMIKFTHQLVIIFTVGIIRQRLATVDKIP